MGLLVLLAERYALHGVIQRARTRCRMPATFHATLRAVVSWAGALAVCTVPGLCHRAKIAPTGWRALSVPPSFAARPFCGDGADRGSALIDIESPHPRDGAG